MYIPPLAHSSLLHSIHLFSLVTLDISEIRQLSNATSGGQVSLCLSTTLSLVAWFASKTRSTHTLSPRLFLLSSLPHLFHSRKFLLILITDFPLSHGYDLLMVLINHGLTKGVHNSSPLFQNYWGKWICPTLFWSCIQTLWTSWHCYLWLWSSICFCFY